jgi:DHA3 family macrolide efflux protein-like MFS transporter
VGHLTPIKGANVESSSGWKARFFTIWGGQAVSMLGSWLVRFGIVWWLTEESGSAAVLSGATLFTLLPQILLSPFIGSLVDRWNRRLILIISDVAIAFLTASLAFMFWRGSVQIWQIYAILLARATGGCFQDPAMMASTSLMVPKSQLTRVNGINQTLFGVIQVIAPALGAFLLSVLSIEALLLVDVLTALPAILPLLFISVPQPEGPTRVGPRPSTWAQMREGFAYLWNWKGMFLLVALSSLTGAFAWPWRATEPLLINDYFGRGPQDLALVMSILGVASIAGGVLMSTWGGFRRRIRTITLGAALLATADFTRGLAPANAFWLFLVGTAIYGVSGGFFRAPFRAIAQATAAPEKQGRIFSLITSLSMGMSPVGLVTLGPLADAIGVQSILLMRGITYVLTVAVCLLVPAVRHVEDKAPEAEEAAALSEGV